MDMEGWQLSPGTPQERSSRDSSPGSRCLQPMLHCPDVLSTHPMTRGHEDLLPTPVLSDAPLSPCVHSPERHSLSLCHCTGLACLGSAGCACRGMCGCQDKIAKIRRDLQSQGRKKAHPPICAALPSGASAQLRPSFLQCNFPGGAASPPQGLAGPVPAPAAAPSAAAPSE